MRGSKHIIYMAAGNSSRFSENKLLYCWKGKPLYRHGLDMLMQIAEKYPDVTLTLVTQYEEIQKDALAKGIRAVYSPRSKEGVSFTIKAAVGAIGEVGVKDSLLFVVADQPGISRETIERFLVFADAEDKADINACAAYGDKVGNPVLFRAQFLPKLLALQGDEGGRKVLRETVYELIQTETDEELWDIDTKEDLPEKGLQID